MPSPISLNKVLKELNISLDRAVEFLSSKKIDIEARPTSKIEQDVYDLLLDEFQTDKSDKDKLEEINTKKRSELEEKQAEEKQAEEKQAEESQGIRSEATESISDKVSADTNKTKDLNIENPKEDVDSSKIQTNFKKLSGLKKTGEVIDLESINKKEEKVEESKKRRRKRISKDVSQPKDSANKFNKNKKQAVNQKVEPTDDEIQKQIRETLEKLQGKSSKSKGAKYRKDKRDQRKIQSEEEEALLEKESKIIKITEFITVGEIATFKDGSEVTVSEDGIYIWKSQNEFTKKKGKRLFITALSPPSFTLDNYKEVLFQEGIGQAFLNTTAVALPSTLIPLIICSFSIMGC